MTHEDNAHGVRGVFARFVHSEVTGSVLLLACTVAALAGYHLGHRDSRVPSRAYR